MVKFTSLSFKSSVFLLNFLNQSIKAVPISDKAEIEIGEPVQCGENVCALSSDELLSQFKDTPAAVAAFNLEDVPQKPFVESKPDDVKIQGLLYEPFDTNFGIAFDNLLEKILIRASQFNGDDNKYERISLDSVPERIQSVLGTLDAKREKVSANFLNPAGLDYYLRTTIWRRVLKVSHHEDQHFNILGFYKATGVNLLFNQFDLDTNLQFQQDYFEYFPAKYSHYVYPVTYLIKPTEQLTSVLNGWFPTHDYTYQIDRGMHYAQLMKYNTAINYIPIGNSQGILYVTMTLFHDNLFPCFFDCTPYDPVTVSEPDTDAEAPNKS